MLAIEPVAGSVIGAKINDADLRQLPSPERREAIEDALEHYGVLIFPGQTITPAQQVAFSRAFAELEPTNHLDARLAGYPEIFVVGNTGKKLVLLAPQTLDGELEWHADHIHVARPARASLFYAREVPPAGGDTLFACTYSGYGALSPAEQGEAKTLTAIHSASGLFRYLDQHTEQGADVAGGRYALAEHETVRWPLVRHHPRSGRPALYFGSHVSVGIVGWPEQRARAYFEKLTALTTQPAFVYRHRWAVGDAVLWDNRRVLHAGTAYDVTAHRREMHRTTWREDRPIK